MPTEFFPVQAQPFQLYGAGVSLGDDTMTLSSFKQIDGTTDLTMSDFGTIGFMTVEPGNGTQEEQISFTGVVQNANGTATLSGISSVGFVTPYVSTANFAKTHPGGSQVVLSNTAAFYNQFPTLPNNGTIDGVYTFTNPNYPRIDTATPPPTDDEQFAPKKYVDDVAIAGAPNATTGVKGIVQLATATQAQAGVGTGSTGASLVPPSNLFNGTSSATIIIPVTDSSGKLDSNFIKGSVAGGFATLDSNGNVVQKPALATTVATPNAIPIANASGRLDTWVSDNVTTFVAGENIDASATPQAVYLNGSDGRVYKLNASTASEAAFAFVGFAPIQAAVTTGNSILVQSAGIVSGFTGLSIGGYYYGTNSAGTISTTPGTQTLLLGRAVTTTTLLIVIGTKVATGTTVFSATGTQGFTIGFKPTHIKINGAITSTGLYSNGGWAVNGAQNSCVYLPDGSPGTAGIDTVNAWRLQASGGTQSGSVSAVLSTGFVLSNVKTSSAPNANLFWEAGA